MSNQPVSFLRISETARLIAAADLTLESEIGVEIKIGSVAATRIGISRLERTGALPLSLFWFNLPQGITGGDESSIRFKAENQVETAVEIGLDLFLSKFCGSQADIAKFFELLFSTLLPALKLRQHQGFNQFINNLCERHAIGKIHAFHIRDMDTAVLQLPKGSTEYSQASAVVLVGADIVFIKTKGGLPSLSGRDSNFTIGIECAPQLLTSTFCILIFNNTTVIAKLATHNFATFRDASAKIGRQQSDIAAAFYAFADVGERRQIDRVEASSAIKTSVAVAAPRQVRFDLETVISLEQGVFVSGWRIDSSKAIRSVEVLDYSLIDNRLERCWKLFKAYVTVEGRPYYVEKFVAFLPRMRKTFGPLRPSVLLKMADGETHALAGPVGPTEPYLKRKAILDHVDERALDLSLLEKVFLPAIGPLHEEINRKQTVEERIDYGSPSGRRVSIIIPIYRNFDFIRHQIFSFFTDPYIRDNCEIIYVNDDPAYGQDLKFLLEGYSTLYDVDMRLLLLGQNGGYSLANNLAAKNAYGETLVLMNSDVVPEEPGWLQEMIEKLAQLPKYSVVGPKLLYADNTLQHAGMYFQKHFSGFWQNMHYYKGYGRDFLPANENRVVGALTGACLITRKSDFLDVKGFSSEFVIGDYEDSDLCFKLRQRGGVCFYWADAALFHFERQSMQSSTQRNDSTTSAYNRALNFRKWKNSGLEMGYLQG